MKILEVTRTNQNIQVAVPAELAFDVGDTPLHSAARWGKAAIAKILIDAGAAIDIKNSLDQTPLHYAVAYQQADIVQMLIAAGADPLIKTNKGLDAIMLAEKIDDPQILSLLTANTCNKIN